MPSLISRNPWTSGRSQLNACWKKLWKEVVNKFGGFPTVDTEMEHIVQLACQVGGERFDDRESNEVVELLDSQTEELT